MLIEMTPRLVSIAALAAAITSAARPAAADDGAAPGDARGWHVGLELDPIPFTLGGYGGLLSFRPDRRWKLGLSSYSADVPDALVTGDNAGFHLHVRPSSVAMVHYSLTSSTRRGGWFVGGMVQQSRTAYTLDGAPGMTTDVSHYELAIDGGYVWYPFEQNGFFLQVWGNVGHDVWSTGTPTVDGRTYQQAWLIPYATVHIGFEI
jgi:hypothetical protein